MFHRRMRLASIGLGLSLLATASAGAQTATGVIDGVIRDPDRQAIPGVTIVANSPALIQRNLTIVSNSEGYYRLTVLPPGAYTVTYSLPGFQTVERTGLIVNAGQTTTIDVQLRLAAIEESVTVIGESPTVDTTRAQLGFNYTQQLLENVPTARNFANMVSTIPGVENTNPYGQSPGNLDKETVLGAGAFNNRYTMEGTNITDPTVSFNVASLFSPDTIQEVQVIRGAKPAEVGFSSGGYFQIVTKSGGNRFSGDSSFFYQGDSLQGTNLNDRLRQAGVTRSNELLRHVDGSIGAGGRIIRDKLWWYGSARREDKTFQLLGFEPEVEDKTRAYFWKNTYQMTKAHRVTGLLTHWSEDVNYFFFGFPPSLADAPDVSMIRDLGGDMAQIRWDAVFTNTLVVQAGFGYNQLRLNQLFQPTATIAKRDLVTGRRFGNPGNGSRISPGSNYDVNGSVSWFIPEAAGRHDIKAGVEFTHSPFSWGFDHIDDHTLGLQRGAPFNVTIVNTPVDAAWLQNYSSAYVQDSWTIKDRLTLNIGVRYDRIEAKLPEQSSGGGDFADTYLAGTFPQLTHRTFSAQDLWTWNSVAPRLAGSFRLDEAGLTAIKGGFARYYQHLNSQQVWSVNPNFPFNITYRWSDTNGDGLFQLGEEGQLLSLSGGGLTDLDPNLRHPYSDEYTIGVSHELFTDFSVNATFIYRTDEDLMYTTSSIPFSTYTPRQVADPGPDGVAGTGDDGTVTAFAADPAFFGRGRSLLTNPDPSDIDVGRDYRAFEVIANKRMSNRWQFVGSFIASRSVVVIPTSESGGAIGGIFQNPNNLINVRGRDDSNQTYQAKLQGTYLAPAGIVLSAFYRYGSGFPFTRQLVVTGLPQGPTTIFAEPRGSRTTDSYHWADFRAEKTFLIGGTKLGFLVDVFNLGNAATVLQYGSRTGVDLGTPRAVRNPRNARVGVRFSW